MGRTVRLCLFTVTSATDGILFRDGPTAGIDAVRYVQFSHRVEISGGARLAASSRSLATPLRLPVEVGDGQHAEISVLFPAVRILSQKRRRGAYQRLCRSAVVIRLQYIVTR